MMHLHGFLWHCWDQAGSWTRRLFGRLLRGSWGPLGASWRHFLGPPGASWGPRKASFWASGGLLEAFWGPAGGQLSGKGEGSTSQFGFPLLGSWGLLGSWEAS